MNIGFCQFGISEMHVGSRIQLLCDIPCIGFTLRLDDIGILYAEGMYFRYIYDVNLRLDGYDDEEGSDVLIKRGSGMVHILLREQEVSINKSCMTEVVSGFTAARPFSITRTASRSRETRTRED